MDFNVIQSVRNKYIIYNLVESLKKIKKSYAIG